MENPLNIEAITSDDTNENVSKNVNKTVSLRGMFSGIIKKLKSKKIRFLCQKCSEIMFTNEDVFGIFAVDNSTFSLIIDPHEIRKILNITREEGISNIDNDLAQFDCIFEECKCPQCSTVIGRYIIGTTQEKEILLNKILIITTKVNALVVEEYSSYLLKLNELLVINASECEEIKEYMKLTSKMSMIFTYLNQKISEISTYKEMKRYLCKTEEYCDNLTRLAKYVKYLQDKNKQENT